MNKQVEVLKYLIDNEYHINQKTLSYHVRRGLLNKGQQGFTIPDILQYAKDNLKKVIDRDTDKGLVTQKLKADIGLTQEKQKRQEIKRRLEEASVMPVSEIERLICGYAAALETYIRNEYVMRVDEMVEAVGGKQSMASDLLELLGDSLDAGLTKFAKNKTLKVKYEIDAD